MVPDVRAIRLGLRMSWQKFADAFHIPLATIKNRGQGRRIPDAPAAAIYVFSSGQPKDYGRVTSVFPHCGRRVGRCGSDCIAGVAGVSPAAAGMNANLWRDLQRRIFFRL